MPQWGKHDGRNAGLDIKLLSWAHGCLSGQYPKRLLSPC
jgi:hypothetical protein